METSDLLGAAGSVRAYGDLCPGGSAKGNGTGSHSGSPAGGGIGAFVPSGGPGLRYAWHEIMPDAGSYRLVSRNVPAPGRGEPRHATCAAPAYAAGAHPFRAGPDPITRRASTSDDRHALRAATAARTVREIARP